MLNNVSRKTNITLSNSVSEKALRETLSKLRGMGNKSIDEVITKLKKVGIDIKEDFDNDFK